MEPRKNVRFAELVKFSGVPEQMTLWSAPEHDREFMRAVREKRVVTLVQQNVGTKKDYGVIGYEPQRYAVYLVFPKALPFPPKSKVVGVKYELLGGGGEKATRSKRSSRSRKKDSARVTSRITRMQKARPRSQRMRASEA